jgi:hypothetical protein
MPLCGRLGKSGSVGSFPARSSRWERSDGNSAHRGAAALTNAKTECTNCLIKDVGRRACGFRNPILDQVLAD